MPLAGTSIASPSAVVAEWSVSQEYTIQQTDVTVQPAPGADLRLVIGYIYIQVNGAVDVLIEEGTTILKWQFYGDAKGAGVAQSGMRIKITENTLISITTSALVTVSLVIGGTVERI